MKRKKFAIRKGKVVLVDMKKQNNYSYKPKMKKTKESYKKELKDLPNPLLKYYGYKPDCPNCKNNLTSPYTECEVCGWINKEEKRSRTIPKHVQREVWRRDMGKCVECGTKELLEYDHIIPFSKGGSNTARNIQLLCEKCNISKSNKI